MTNYLRWLFNRPCRESFCNGRRRCWRWHVEIDTCPTCGTVVTEFDPNYERVIDMHLSGLTQPAGVSITLNGQPAYFDSLVGAYTTYRCPHSLRLGLRRGLPRVASTSAETRPQRR